MDHAERQVKRLLLYVGKKIARIIGFSYIFIFKKVVCISQDSFYRELEQAEKVKAEKGLFNFDHPSAFDEEHLLETLKNILEGQKVEIPVYDFKNNARSEFYIQFNLNQTISGYSF